MRHLPAALMQVRGTKGVAILSGVHPEYDPALLDPQQPTHAAVAAPLAAAAVARAALWRSLLRRLGLKTVEVPQDPPLLTHLVLVVAGLPPTHAIPAELSARLSNAATTLLDTGDPDGACARPSGPRVPTRRPADPEAAVPHPVGVAMAVDVGPPPHALVARAASPLAIYPCDQLPRDAPAATWDTTLYWQCLRRHHGGSLTVDPAAAGAAGLAWGAALLYGEVVASTQTLLERCAVRPVRAAACVCVCVCVLT
jgi:hypothetical protein